MRGVVDVVCAVGMFIGASMVVSSVTALLSMAAFLAGRSAGVW